MTDTRPHFWFENSDGQYFLFGENLDSNMEYGILTLNDNVHIYYAPYYGIMSDGIFYNGDISIIEVNDTSLLEDICMEKDTFTIEEIESYFENYGIQYRLSNDFSAPNGEGYIDDILISTPTVSWTINNKTVQTLHIGQKEIQTITRVSDGVILYQKSNESINEPQLIPTQLSVTGTKSVLSHYHQESSVLTATVLDDNDNPCSGETVTFKNGSTVLDTVQTDSNGEASYTYQSTGADDVTINVECINLQETYEIEDCIYAYLTQIDTPKNNSTYHYLNNDVISNLPSTYSIEFDMKTSNNPQNNAEIRIYWSPSTLWNNSSQPSEALFIGYCYDGGNKYEFGKRLNGRTENLKKTGMVANTWDSVKFEKTDNSSRFYGYLNSDTSWDYWTLTNAKNYSTWVFGLALWADTTFSIRNIKIKPL